MRSIETRVCCGTAAVAAIENATATTASNELARRRGIRSRFRRWSEANADARAFTDLITSATYHRIPLFDRTDDLNEIPLRGSLFYIDPFGGSVFHADH